MAITKKTYKTREEWLADRLDGFKVGGSNIGVIIGLCRFCTPYQLWYNHFNSESVQNDHMARGNFMEDGVAQWFMSQTGVRIVARSANIEVYKNDKYPDYFQVAPDREAFADGKKKRPLVEIKDTTYIIDTLENLQEKEPEWYAQLQYELGMLERDQIYLAVNDGRKRLYHADFFFDQEYFDWMMEVATEWVERYILGGEEPPMTTAEDVALAHPESQPIAKKIGSADYKVVETYRMKKGAEKLLKEQIDGLRDKIAVICGEAESLEYEGTTVATYKTDARGVRSLRVS